MALLKFQNGFRGFNHQTCCFVSAKPATNSWDGCGCRLSGTAASSISRRASTDRNGQNNNNNKDDNNNNNNDDAQNQNSNSNKTKRGIRKLRARLDISQLGVNVPLKIAEMNKLITDTSRKIINSGFNIRGSNATNSVGSGNVDESSIYSLEKTVTKINQSILSYYDSSYINDNVYEARPGGTTTLSMEKVEVLDDDFANVPRSSDPEFSTSLPPVVEAKKKIAKERRAEKISRMSLESRTTALVHGLKSAYSLMSRMTRLEELCAHLIAHPECVWEASNEKLWPVLLKLAESRDKNLKGMANQCLSLIGYAKPLKSPGIRILSIDGGGTRGLVAMEFLKALEKQTGKNVYQLFDYVCGVSTGALLAAMLCLYKLPLDQCEQMYKQFSIKTFTRNRVVGTTRLVWNHGFYDTQIWEKILRKEMGNTPFIEFSRDPDVPKMSAVSAIVTASSMANHLFRTYNLPPGVTSQYPGHCKHKIWEVIRASSAAPGYFEPFNLAGDVHEDGGILTNNPTALAIHESRLLWEKENFHCVVSLGTGRFQMKEDLPAKLSLKRRISTIVDSACDTEAVHQTLQDLLPAKSYFRFNPYMSEEFFLDEIRPEKLEQMQHDARMYNRRNSYKLTTVAERLVETRKPQQVVGDWMRSFVDRI